MKISNEFYYLLCVGLSIAIYIPLVNLFNNYLPASNTAFYLFAILVLGWISASAATLIVSAVKSLIGSPNNLSDILDDEAPTDKH